MQIYSFSYRNIHKNMAHLLNLHQGECKKQQHDGDGHMVSIFITKVRHLETLSVNCDCVWAPSIDVGPPPLVRLWCLHPHRESFCIQSILNTLELRQQSVMAEAFMLFETNHQEEVELSWYISSIKAAECPHQFTWRCHRPVSKKQAFINLRTWSLYNHQNEF